MITPPKPPPSVIGMVNPNVIAHLPPTPAPTPAQQASHNHVLEEDALKAQKPMTVTDDGVSFNSAPGTTSVVDVNGDIFDLSGTTANVLLLNSQALYAINATTTISFVNSTEVNLTAGTGHDIVTALKGTNTFTSLTSGTLDVTGGTGADTYRLGYLSDGMTIEDFSIAKGDQLVVDNNFKGLSIKSTTDGAGGTFLDFQDGPHHYVQVDLKGVIANTSIIHFAAVG